jgi:hypothetical protein
LTLPSKYLHKSRRAETSTRSVVSPEAFGPPNDDLLSADLLHPAAAVEQQLDSPGIYKTADMKNPFQAKPFPSYF